MFVPNSEIDPVLLAKGVLVVSVPNRSDEDEFFCIKRDAQAYRAKIDQSRPPDQRVDLVHLESLRDNFCIDFHVVGMQTTMLLESKPGVLVVSGRPREVSMVRSLGSCHLCSWDRNLIERMTGSKTSVMEFEVTDSSQIVSFDEFPICANGQRSLLVVTRVRPLIFGGRSCSAFDILRNILNEVHIEADDDFGIDPSDRIDCDIIINCVTSEMNTLRDGKWDQYLIALAILLTGIAANVDALKLLSVLNDDFFDAVIRDIRTSGSGRIVDLIQVARLAAKAIEICPYDRAQGEWVEIALGEAKCNRDLLGPDEDQLKMIQKELSKCLPEARENGVSLMAVKSGITALLSFATFGMKTLCRLTDFLYAEPDLRAETAMLLPYLLPISFEDRDDFLFERVACLTLRVYHDASRELRVLIKDFWGEWRTNGRHLRDLQRVLNSFLRNEMPDQLRQCLSDNRFLRAGKIKEKIDALVEKMLPVGLSDVTREAQGCIEELVKSSTDLLWKRELMQSQWEVEMSMMLNVFDRMQMGDNH
jgi:hypothetical protein